MDVNRATILGRVAGEISIWVSPKGAKVARFTVALNRQYQNPVTHQVIKKVAWVPVAVWGTRAKPCQEYLSKGDLVFVEGHIDTGSWTDKKGIKRHSIHVTAQNVKFLSGNKIRKTKENI